MEQPHGHGIYYDENGMKMYEGQWRDGDKHGDGVEYDEGQITFQGKFVDDQAIDG